MFAVQSKKPETETPAPPSSAREEQRRRNAAARCKLEALRDQMRLRMQLTDVWDEFGDV
jgi:hypothetical protein